MLAPAGIARVIVVILDGLRADAIPLYQLPELEALQRNGAATLTARTVTPSITMTALTSLFTGVGPAVHGMASDRIQLPRNAAELMPLPRWLGRHGIPSYGYRACLPLPFRGIGKRIAAGLEARITFSGTNAAQILGQALPGLAGREPGFWFLHWPDADTAGHASGWSSRQYVDALGRYDEAIGRLVRETDAVRDPGTVLIVLADHGGGGMVARDHASDHPLDTTIPLILAGGQVRSGRLAPDCSLLDVPATVPWLFGLRAPLGYQGRILREAFTAEVAAPMLVAA